MIIIKHQPANYLLALALLMPLFALGADISLGVNGSMSGGAYKARHHDYQVLPVPGYDNDIWYLSGAEAGYYLLNDDVNELAIKTFYDGNAYDASEGRGEAMRRLHDRHATLMAGASYQVTTPWGALRTQLAADVLNHSKGVTANVAYLSLLPFGALVLVPEVGADWANGQQNRYYYGVSASESRRSGIAAWRPGSAFTPYGALTLDYRLTEHWESWSTLRMDWLPSTVRRSPMVDRNTTWSISLGINYNF